jgi:TonB family protein
MNRITSLRGLAGRLAVVILAATIVRGADAGGRTEPRVKERIQAVYPYDLALQGVEGEVELQFRVDPDGFARDIIVAKAQEPAFGFAAKAMLEAWEFEPATENGLPVAAMQQSLNVRFDSASAAVALGASAQGLLAELKKGKPDIPKASALDAVPWAVKMVRPVYPRDLMKGIRISGGATIDFFVDGDGRVQLPRIVSATQWEFGWAAATALLRSEFTPPKKGGAPAVTRMRIPVVFAAPAGLKDGADR